MIDKMCCPIFGRLGFNVPDRIRAIPELGTKAASTSTSRFPSDRTNFAPQTGITYARGMGALAGILEPRPDRPASQHHANPIPSDTHRAL